MFPYEAKSDVARRAIFIKKLLKKQQIETASAENCRVPVIAALHGHVIGAAIDLTSGADIRMCAEGAQFSIREIDIGLNADIGVLQRIQRIVGNNSWAREVVYTGRFFNPEEALKQGLVSRVAKDKEALDKEAWELAKTIASKSPVAIHGIKETLNFARDHTIADGLLQVRSLNGSLT